MNSGALDRQEAIPLFLYGTLRAGGRMHALVAPFVEKRVEARVWGRLYHVRAGYPALHMSTVGILARGTDDLTVDLRALHSIDPIECMPAPGDWQWIEGDLIWLRAPETSVPPIDHYEGFEFQSPSLYERVLVPVQTESRTKLAWTYVKAPEGSDIRLKGSRWDPNKTY